MSTDLTEEQRTELAAIRTMVAEVVRVEDVHPHLRQITVTGDDLRSFRPLGPDTFLYVLLPPPGRAELTIDRSFTWAGYETMAAEERPVGAYYTLRRWRPEVAELDLHFVLHAHDDDDGGHASRWAATARPGDPLCLWGPRTSWHPPAGTERYLLVADETGLPAVGAILETLPEDARVTVIAEVDTAAEQVALRLHHGVVVHWLHREGRAAGTTSLLVDEVRATHLHPEGLYAWGGAESHAVTAVRKHLRRELGCRREQVSMVGYWRLPSLGPDDDEE